MRRKITAGLIAAALLGAILPGTAAANRHDRGHLLVLGTNGVLSTYSTGFSLLPKESVKVRGVARGDKLIGIDVRPANGVLYAMSARGQLYTVDEHSGHATAVGTPVALTGSAIGFDFNPTVDRIRVVTDRGQNLRLVPDNGALAATDGPLAYAPTDPAAGRTPVVGGAGYTNSVAGATSTLLYDLDAGRDTLLTQGTAPGVTPVVSPNTGQLFTVGRLGVDISAVHGFDIHPDGKAIAAVSTRGFLGLKVSKLVRVDLSTGRATPISVLLLSTPVGLAFTS